MTVLGAFVWTHDVVVTDMHGDLLIRTISSSGPIGPRWIWIGGRKIKMKQFTVLMSLWEIYSVKVNNFIQVIYKLPMQFYILFLQQDFKWMGETENAKKNSIFSHSPCIIKRIVKDQVWKIRWLYGNHSSTTFISNLLVFGYALEFWMQKTNFSTDFPHRFELIEPNDYLSLMDGVWNSSIETIHNWNVIVRCLLS